jgi:hypothetical protein
VLNIFKEAWQGGRGGGSGLGGHVAAEGTWGPAPTGGRRPSRQELSHDRNRRWHVHVQLALKQGRQGR